MDRTHTFDVTVSICTSLLFLGIVFARVIQILVYCRCFK